MVRAAKDAKIHQEILSLGGYSKKLKKDGNNLSGGQKQRLEIARALSQNPKILILDQATSALDCETEQHIFSSIQKRNLTLIIISNKLPNLNINHRVIILDDIV